MKFLVSGSPWETNGSPRAATFIPLALFVVCFLFETDVNANGPRVVLLRPQDKAASRVEPALARVEGELSAAGFQVISHVLPVPRSASIRPSPREEVEAALIRHDALAALLLTHDRGETDIWVSERLHGRTVVQRVQTAKISDERSDPAAVLAFSAVEVLRANLAEIWREPKAALTAKPVERAAPEPPVVRGDEPPGELEMQSASTGGGVSSQKLRWQLMGESRAVGGAELLLWGAAAGVGGDFDFGSMPWSWLVDLSVDGGAEDLAVGEVSLLAFTVGLSAGPRLGFSWGHLHLAAGVRAGVLRMEASVDPTEPYDARSSVGPWVGPALALGVNGLMGRRYFWQLTADGGDALWASTGTFPAETGNQPLSTGGLWVGVRLGVGVR